MIACESVPARKRGRLPAGKAQKVSIVQTVLDLVRHELAPLKHAISIILQKLDIHCSLEPAELIFPKNQQKIRRRTSMKKEEPKQDKQLDQSFLEGLHHLEQFENELDLEDAFSLDNIIPLEGFSPFEAEREDFVFPQPRGNNSNFNLQALPESAAVEEIEEEHRAQWSGMYGRVRRLVEGKRARRERGWFDFEKKMLLELVTKGSQFGANISKLTLMLGVSHSTLKRWRNYFA